MNTRTALRKSVLIAPAEAALRRAETQEELEDAWMDYCAGFSEDSTEWWELRRAYQECRQKLGVLQ